MNAEFPNICFAHPSIFNALEIEKFEAEILSNPKAAEHDASKFFAAHPKFLLLGEGKEIRRETVLFGPDDNPIGRVDFFRKSFGRSTWDIIELKQPHIEFACGIDTKHPYLSAGVQKAVSQVLDYRQWIDESAGIRTKLNEKGIFVFRPGMVVIAGRGNRQLPPELAAELTDRIRRLGVQLVTYDALLDFAKEHYQSNHVIVLPASLLIADVPWAVFRKDLHGRITFANNEYARLLGKAPHEIIGHTDFDFYPRELAERYHQADHEVIRSVLTFDSAEDHVAPNGQRALVHVIKTPLIDKKGKVIGIEARFRAVTKNSISTSSA